MTIMILTLIHNAIQDSMVLVGDWLLDIIRNMPFCNSYIDVTLMTDTAISEFDFESWTEESLDKYIASNGEWKPDYVRLAEALKIRWEMKEKL